MRDLYNNCGTTATTATDKVLVEEQLEAQKTKTKKPEDTNIHMTKKEEQKVTVIYGDGMVIVSEDGKIVDKNVRDYLQEEELKKKTQEIKKQNHEQKISSIIEKKLEDDWLSMKP